MNILRKRFRAEAEAQELAYQATIASASDEPVPAALVMWGKDLRRNQINLIRQQLLYIEKGAARKLIDETWAGLEQMQQTVTAYAKRLLGPRVVHVPRPVLMESDRHVIPSGRTRAVLYRADEADRAG